MQRKAMQGDRDRGGITQRGTTRPMAGQPRPESDEHELEAPRNAPIFLTAHELQSRHPGKPPADASERMSKKGRGRSKSG